MKKIFCLFSLLAFLTLPAQAMAYTISLNPIPQTIGLGDTTIINIDLGLSGPEALNYFNLNLAFNNAILGFSGFSTTLMNPLDPLDPLFDYVGGFTDNGTGIAFNGFFAPFDPLKNPLTGSITLAQLSFMGIGNGTSQLNLTGELDLGNQGLDIVSAFATVNSNMNAVPEPGTFVLLGLGLAGLFGYRRKFLNA